MLLLILGIVVCVVTLVTCGVIGVANKMSGSPAAGYRGWPIFLVGMTIAAVLLLIHLLG